MSHWIRTIGTLIAVVAAITFSQQPTADSAAESESVDVPILVTDLPMVAIRIENRSGAEAVLLRIEADQESVVARIDSADQTFDVSSGFYMIADQSGENGYPVPALSQLAGNKIDNPGIE